LAAHLRLIRFIVAAALLGAACAPTLAQTEPRQQDTGSGAGDEPSDDDLFARVFGQREQAPAAVALDLEVRVQGVILGNMPATVEGQALQSMDREALVDLLDGLVAPRFLEPLSTLPARIEPAALREAGFGADYAPAELALHLAIPAAYRVEWNVPLAPIRPPAPGRNRYGGARVSGALNLLPSVIHSSDGNRTQTAIAAEGFLNIAGWALQGDATWSERTNTLRRGPVRLHRDWIDTQVRVTVGELRSPAFGQQPALPLRGFSIGRRFSIDPYDPPFPGLIAPLLLESPTEVEVTVDGRLVDRFRLPAGPVLLSDFPLSAGLSNVRVDLLRDGVLQRSLSYPGWFDRTRLGAGRQEFHVSLGQPWQQGARRPRKQQDEPWLSAAIRRGISSRWTSGIGLVADFDSKDAVVDWSNDLGFPRWSLTSNLAIGGDGLPGTAGSIGLQQEPAVGDVWSLRAAFGWRDSRFVPFGLDAAPGREVRAELSASRPLAQGWRWSGTTRVADTQEGRTGSLSSVLSWRPSPEWTTQLRATVQQGAGRDDLQITLFIDWRPGAGEHAFSTELADDGSWLLGWRTNRQRTRTGHNASVTLVDDANGREWFAGGSVRTHRFRAGLDHRWTVGDGARTRATAQTALVFADGHWGVTDRVGEGFVLFAGRPGTGVVEVNPDEGDWRSRSGMLGPAVIGDLTPYLERGFTLGLPEVPVRSDPGDLQPVARAGFLQGSVIPVGPVPGVTLTFSVRRASGDPLALTVGRLVPVAGGKPIRFFSNRDGRVEVGSVPAGSYRLVVPSIDLDETIDVAESPRVQELGEWTS
jgi:outer membrane usher protein